VIVQSQGAGNVLDVVTFNNTHVDSTQEVGSTNIGSTINADVSDVYGGVSISASDGETRIIGAGEVILVEDTSGKGHCSKAIKGKMRHSIFVPIE